MNIYATRIQSDADCRTDRSSLFFIPLLVETTENSQFPFLLLHSFERARRGVLDKKEFTAGSSFVFVRLSFSVLVSVCLRIYVYEVYLCIVKCMKRGQSANILSS